MLFPKVKLEDIYESSPGLFQNYSDEFLREIKNQRKQNVNSQIIKTSVEFYLSNFDSHSSFKSSFSAGQILKYHSQLLLEHASSEPDLTKALLDITDSIQILSSSKMNNSINELVSAHLIRSVLLKVLGDKDEALYSLKDSQHELRNLISSDLELIKLRRQEQIIHQTQLSHKFLFKDANKIKGYNLIEYYSSIKRLFEFFMNNGFIENAGRIYNNFVKTFHSVQWDLPLISHLSFLKNIGQFNILIGKKNDGIRLLKVAYNKALSLKLTGQMEQLKNLLTNYESPSEFKLVTYRSSSLLLLQLKIIDNYRKA